MSGRDHQTNESATEQSGRFAYDGLERVMHERARLGLMTSLLAHPDGLLFTDLKELCSLTDGNLSRHLKALGEADLVETRKSSEGARPQTMCFLTDNGRRRFIEYVAVLQQVVQDASSLNDATTGTAEAGGNLLPATT